MVITKAVRKRKRSKAGLWTAFVICLLLLAGISGYAASSGMGADVAADRTAAAWIASTVNENATLIWRTVASFGSSSAIIGMTILLTIVAGFVSGWRRAWWIPAAVAVSYLVNTGMKIVFDRARPDAAWGIEVNGASFPSANAMLAVTLFMMFALTMNRSKRLHPAIRAAVMLLAVAATAATLWSRLYFSVHYATDIAAGAAAGAAIVFAAAALSKSRY